MSTEHDKVLVHYVDAPGSGKGKKLAILTLNKPKALNALDLDMVNSLLTAFDEIRFLDDIVAVLLDSAGDKAFCAGGDIVSMHSAMKAHRGSPDIANAEKTTTPQFLQDFFTQEYRLDYCIHTFPKPVIVWGHGIIMGGGLGLFAGAQIKIVTESARIAMPEITIGLFPDVGGSYFLNRLPEGVGLFLGLTAANINAKDNLAIGMADAIIQHSDKDAFIRALRELQSVDKNAIFKLAKSFEKVDIETREANLPSYLSELAKLGQATSLKDAASKLQQIVEHQQSAYLSKAFASFEKGSPITAHLVFEQLKRAKSYSLAECFRMELSMAFTCGALGEFEEGVRALLIDKDNQADWLYVDINAVPQMVIEQHFSQFLGNAENSDKSLHPLAHLEQDFGVLK